jgi:hypothetical protein
MAVLTRSKQSTNRSRAKRDKEEGKVQTRCEVKGISVGRIK